MQSYTKQESKHVNFRNSLREKIVGSKQYLFLEWVRLIYLLNDISCLLRTDLSGPVCVEVSGNLLIRTYKGGPGKMVVSLWLYSMGIQTRSEKG